MSRKLTPLNASSWRQSGLHERSFRNKIPNLPRRPNVADTAPSDSVLTAYDEEHLVTYLRLLDVDLEGCGLARSRTNGAPY